MPATPTRIGFISHEFRTVKNGPDAGVVAKYGKAARRSDLVETFFEVEADAQAMCDERMGLLSADRRRFAQTVSGEATGMVMAYTSTPPAANVIDDLRQADHDALVSEITIDFTREETRIESWG
jgi:hypothetical protein